MVVNRCAVNIPANQSYPMLDYDSKFGVVDDNFYLGDQSKVKIRNKMGPGNVSLLGEDQPVRVMGVRPLRNSSGQIGMKYRPVAVEVDSADKNITGGKDGKPPPKGRRTFMVRCSFRIIATLVDSM